MAGATGCENVHLFLLAKGCVVYWSWLFEREVFWQWTGEYKDISGFTILLNGQKMKTVPAKERKTIVQMSTSCGLDNKWEVVANGKDGTSPVSSHLKK